MADKYKRVKWILDWDRKKENTDTYNNEIEKIYKILNELDKRITALGG